MKTEFVVDIREISDLAHRMTEKEVERCAKAGIRRGLSIMKKGVTDYVKPRLPHRSGSDYPPLYRDVKIAVWKRPQGKSVAGGTVSLLEPRKKGQKSKNRAYVLRFYNAAPTKRGHLDKFSGMNNFFERSIASAKERAERDVERLVAEQIIKKANKDGMR